MVDQDSTALIILAEIAGYLATISFAIQYIPQAYLNYKRKSVKGYSPIGVTIKLIGASFLAINSILLKEMIPICLYGILNVSQHLFFMIQFAIYDNDRRYYSFFLLPIFAFLLGTLLPSSIPYTNSLKPISQFLSHLPQLYLSYKKKTTEGVSLTTQHLNMIGGVCGLFMYSIVEAKTYSTVLMYWSSLFQAISLYIFAIYFDGWMSFLVSFPFVGEVYDYKLPMTIPTAHISSPISTSKHVGKKINEDYSQ